MKTASIIIGATLTLAATAHAEGPISKFQSKAPEATFMSSAKLEDIERCLMDMNGLFPPTVYRQPDRPDEAMLIWRGSMGLTLGRIDLHRDGDRTKVTSWFAAKQVAGCAPVAG